MSIYTWIRINLIYNVLVSTHACRSPILIGRSWYFTKIEIIDHPPCAPSPSITNSWLDILIFHPYTRLNDWFFRCVILLIVISTSENYIFFLILISFNQDIKEIPNIALKNLEVQIFKMKKILSRERFPFNEPYCWTYVFRLL